MAKMAIVVTHGSGSDKSSVAMTIGNRGLKLAPPLRLLPRHLEGAHRAQVRCRGCNRVRREAIQLVLA